MSFWVYAIGAMAMLFVPSMLIEAQCRRLGLSRLQTVDLRWWALLSWPGYLIARSKLKKLEAERTSHSEPERSPPPS